jgi:CelD/BcsL family acetyltransferase involved in cellulose biosynthesis
MTDVCEINTIEKLGEYRQVWRALLEQTAWANFFQSLDWLEVYWRHFDEGQTLRVLVVSSDGRPMGILPLVVLTEHTKVGPLRVLTYPLHNWGSYYGPIGPEPRETLVAGLQYILASRHDWDMIELRWSGIGASDREQTESAMRTVGLQAYRTVWDQTAVIDLPDSWDTYWASRTKKWRCSVNRWQRRLADCGEVSYLRYRPRGESHGEGDPRWDLYDACEELARRSWQGSSTSGTTLSHESVRPFLRDVHAAAARVGAVDLNLLLLNGRPLAFAYNYQWRGSVYGLRMGYDAEVSRQGPGNVLFAWAIRDSIERGDYFHDMGVGSLDIKRHFLTRVVPVLRYSHYPVSVPRTQVLRLKRWIEQSRLPADSLTQGPAIPLLGEGNDGLPCTSCPPAYH